MTIAESINFRDQRFHMDAYRLDQSYRQGRMQPHYDFSAKWCEMPRMGNTLDIDSIRSSLRRIMQEKGVLPTPLSLKIGNSKTAVKELLEKNDDVKLSTLVKLSSALNVDIDELLQRPKVAVAGYIGAGGTVVFEAYGETDPDYFVMRPPGISGQLCALIVRGESMLPKYSDGDVIYIQRDICEIAPWYMGLDCAVRLVSGETYVKQIVQGSKPDRFTLRSLNAADMSDMEVEWASPVLFILPSAARRLMAQ